MLAMCPTSDVATLTAPRKWRFALVVFFGQDVALKRLAPLNGAARTHAKALFGRALGFHFWHVDALFVCAREVPATPAVL